MSEEEKKDTENKIFEAAISIFTTKGFSGARMQEIADKANINKALLHYYFRSKNKLFEAVFEYLIRKMAPLFGNILKGSQTIEEKFAVYFDKHISFMQKYPFIPGFVINELNQDPEKLVRLFNYGQFPLKDLLDQVEEEIKAGRVKDVNPKQVLINMIALSVFPFMAKPLLKEALHFDSESFHDFIEERKRVLPKMMWDMIRVQ